MTGVRRMMLCAAAVAAIGASGILPAHATSATSPSGTAVVGSAGGATSVALIASSSPPTPDDASLRSRLSGLGHLVTVVDDDDAASTDLSRFGLIVVSGSVSSAMLPLSLRTLPVPLISNTGPGSVRLRLGSGWTSTTATALTITEPSHPLAGGLSGRVVVSTSAKFTLLTPPSGAVAVARTFATSPQTTIAGIEAGGALTVGSAPARRVGFFVGGPTASKLSPQGWQLFDSAVGWALGSAPPAPPPPATGGTWADAERDFRLPVTITTGVNERAATAIDVDVDLAAALVAAGGAGTVDVRSLRLVEVDAAGTVVDATVSSQFDQRAGSPAGVGTIVVGVEGVTGAGSTRRYHVYFDTTGSGFTPVTTAAQVGVTTADDAGQSSFVASTPAGQWAYHKLGGGFSSLVDPSGNDWLNYSTTPGSAGSFRGIPNAVHPEGHFHPGATTSVTTLVASGPLKATIESVVGGGAWAVRWEIYPDRAHMSVLAAARPYWFLYEGTPGGQIDAGDLVVRPTGTPTALSQAWSGDLVSTEFVGFIDPARDRSLVVLHHQDDTAIDSHRLMEGNMTVFGFGRDKLNKGLTGTSNTFTVALLETDDTAAVRRGALGLLTPPATGVGTPVARQPG